jgi:hypothetical protein
MDDLVTRDGHDVIVCHPVHRNVKWNMTFPAANEMHEALSKVLVDNMITMRAPFGPEQVSEDIAAHILADLDQACDEGERTKMPLLERLSWFRKILSGSDYERR